MPRKITPEVHERMVRLRRRGMTYAEIAGKLGTSLKTVAVRMRDEGLGGKRKVTPEVMEEMRRLRGEGLTYEKIAERLGLSMMTVYSHLRRKPGIIGRLRRRLGLG